MSYLSIATPMAERGVPTVPLRAGTKVAFLNGWEELATVSPNQIAQWDAAHPGSNCGSVAQAKLGGFWFFEVDSPEVNQRIEAETGQKLPATFTVRSSPGKGHIYFKQSAASIAMGNIAQGFIKHNDWSARVDRQYVVSPGSLHPKTQLPYEIRSHAEIVEAPQWLINWLISQKLDKKSVLAAAADGPIITGGRNNALTSLGGKLRHAGLDHAMIELALLDANEKRCQPQLSETEVKTIAASVSRYEPAKELTFTIGGKLPEQTVAASATRAATASAEVQPEQVDPVVVVAVPHPIFPSWVMNGTSLYEHFVKPICEQNSRYPEFMWLPAMALLLNYIGGKVRIEHNPNLVPSIFLVTIGRAGRAFKSSSVEDAIKHFNYVGVMAHATPSTPNADGKSLIWSVGSPEGLGKEMARTSCKNAVLFYDELSSLTNKASIESSSLTSQLLTMYESGKFENIVKSPKDSFSHAPGTYCATLIACTTDKNFLPLWAKLSGSTSGLNERFFFLYQPPKLKDRTTQVFVNTAEGSMVTRKLIDKALTQKMYKFEDLKALNASVNTIDNRQHIRLQKFALGFAIDLGLDMIDGDCLDRALALMEYEGAVKKFLQSFDGYSKQATAQQEILYHLGQSNGSIEITELNRKMHPERYGTTDWYHIYNGLLKSGWTAEAGKGVKGDPKRLVLLRVPENEDD